MSYSEEDDDELECQLCDNIAVYKVAVSINTSHDSEYRLCYGCYQAYLVGVQHGRWHEAVRLGTVPGRDSSQEKPEV